MVAFFYMSNQFNTNKLMKKYITIIKAYFQLSLRFRVESLLWMFMDLLPVIFMLIIWQTIFTQGDEISGVNLNQVIQFYLLSSVISSWTGVHFENTRSLQIKNGGLDQFLTKPHQFWIDIILKDLAKLLFYKPISLLILLGGYSLWAGSTTLEFSNMLIKPDFYLVLGLMFVAYCLNVLFGFMITFTTFWFEGAQGLEHFKWMSVALFSGSIMPLALLPDWIQKVIWFLPFKYLYAVPIMVGLNQYRLQVSDVVYLGSTLAVVAILTNLLWRQGIKKYSAVGS